ncbi:SCO family protein [Candidatus Leptofilum sp.]|uniref:SCO family protein n=1 Tax=Candidatus Leptofilum sp. TaxID=3241576 RepID=UPI003B5CE183
MAATAPTAVSPHRSSGMLIWRLFFVLFGLMAAGVIWFSTARPITVLPRITLAPGFYFTDQTEEKFTSEDLRGQIALYNFTYTNCTEPCVQTGSVMAQVQSRLPEIASSIPLKLVTFSIDPIRDDATQLATFAEEMGADTAVWHFATGGEQQLKSVIGGGFSVYYKAQEDGRFKMDPAFFLVDGNGVIRAEYRTDTPDIEIIMRDFGLLAAEVDHSEGIYRFAYEAAHLFSCYPR